MPLSQIQIIIKSGLAEQIMGFFIDFYFYEKSPILPVCVLADVVDHASLADPVSVSLTNWRIAQLPDNEFDDSRKLATITFSEYPAGLALIFRFEESNRDSITPMITHIQEKLRGLGYKNIHNEKMRGPTDKTRARAEEFKKIKDLHREWNLDKVADKYNLEFGGDVTAESVRNAYRAMGWDWERADRIR